MMEKYFHPENKKPWILLALLVKILLCFYLYNVKIYPDKITPLFALNNGDTFSYFGSIDNLVETGKYNPFYRMPGVGFVYFLFRQFFSQNISYELFGFFQIVFDVLACYLLARLAFQLTKRKLFFLITYILGVTNTYYSLYDIWLLSESICTSALIFSAYYFYQTIFDSNKSRNFLLSGFFITWAIFCRPAYFPILFIYILLFIFYLYKSKKKVLVKSIFLFCMPFIILDAAWVYAGYQHSQKIYFLQHSSHALNKETNKQEEAYVVESWRIALRNYIAAFGGDVVDWNPDAEIAWFDINPSCKAKIEHLPAYAFTDYFNEDSLLGIKKDIKILLQPETKLSIKDNTYKSIEGRLKRYTAEFKKDKPLHYHVLSRCILLKKLLFQPSTYNLYFKSYSELSVIHKAIKIFYYLMYYVYLSGFFLSFFFIVLNRKMYLFLPIILLALFGILIFPVLRYCDYRYIVPAVPFMVILSSYSIYSLLNLVVKENGKDTLFRP